MSYRENSTGPAVQLLSGEGIAGSGLRLGSSREKAEGSADGPRPGWEDPIIEKWAKKKHKHLFRNGPQARKWRNWNPVHCWWECKMVQSLWETVGRLLKKIKK